VLFGDQRGAQFVRFVIILDDGAGQRRALILLEDEDRIAFRYCAPDGSSSEATNPNGSALNIAGIYNETGRVLGMMPHPERAVEPALGSSDGLALFQSIAEVLA